MTTTDIQERKAAILGFSFLGAAIFCFASALLFGASFVRLFVEPQYVQQEYTKIISEFILLGFALAITVLASGLFFWINRRTVTRIKEGNSPGCIFGTIVSAFFASLIIGSVINQMAFGNLYVNIGGLLAGACTATFMILGFAFLNKIPH